VTTQGPRSRRHGGSAGAPAPPAPGLRPPAPGLRPPGSGPRAPGSGLRAPGSGLRAPGAVNGHRTRKRERERVGGGAGQRLAVQPRNLTPWPPPHRWGGRERSVSGMGRGEVSGFDATPWSDTSRISRSSPPSLLPPLRFTCPCPVPAHGARGPGAGGRGPGAGTRSPEAGTRRPEPGARGPEPGGWGLGAGGPGSRSAGRPGMGRVFNRTQAPVQLDTSPRATGQAAPGPSEGEAQKLR
jgi:translation initiation factor IF-2